MPDAKKNTINFNGNNIMQVADTNFVDDYTTWRAHCQSIGSAALHVKHIPNLYIMLKKHLDGNIRSGSRNKNRDGEGAIEEQRH